MKRRRRLVLACSVTVCGMCAMSGASAYASNNIFTSEKYPDKVKSRATNDQGFKASVATSVCTKGAFTEVGETTGTSNELVVHPEYSECSAGLSGVKYPVKVETTGCNYRFFDSGNDVNIECESGKEIHVVLEGAAACKINTPAQSGLKTVTYNDTKNGSGTKVVDVEANVKEIEFNSNCSGVIGGKTAEYREGKFGPIVPELGEGPAKAETEGFSENELGEFITPDGVGAQGEPTYTASLSTYEYEGKEVKLRPGAVAIDPSGKIWVFDSAHDHLVEFNSKNEFVRQVGTEGDGTGQFSFFDESIPGAVGIATNSSGDVYVSDFGNNRVEEFNEKGEYVREFGVAGTSEEQVRLPGAIAVDSGGNVWVLNSFDTEGARVHEYSPTGTYMSRFGATGNGEGQLQWAFGMAFSGGNLYVADFSHQRVLEFSTAGKLERTFDEAGSGAGQSDVPWGIAAEPSTGDLYVAETAGDRVQEFSAAGSYITAFGSAGTSAGHFGGPRGLAANSEGHAVVADTGNKRTQEWVLTP